MEAQTKIRNRVMLLIQRARLWPRAGFADNLSARGSGFAHTPDQVKPACARKPHSDASSKPQSLYRRPHPGPESEG